MTPVKMGFVEHSPAHTNKYQETPTSNQNLPSDKATGTHLSSIFYTTTKRITEDTMVASFCHGILAWSPLILMVWQYLSVQTITFSSTTWQRQYSAIPLRYQSPLQVGPEFVRWETFPLVNPAAHLDIPKTRENSQGATDCSVTADTQNHLGSGYQPPRTTCYIMNYFVTTRGDLALYHNTHLQLLPW